MSRSDGGHPHLPAAVQARPEPVSPTKSTTCMPALARKLPMPEAQSCAAPNRGDRSMKRHVSLAVFSFLGGMIVNASAAESPYARLESLDRRFDALIAPGTKIEKIAEDLEWSEGPLWDARSKTPLFSDIPRNVIMQWPEEKG